MTDTLRDLISAVLGKDPYGLHQTDTVMRIIQNRLNELWTGDRQPVHVLDELQFDLEPPSDDD